MKITASEEYGVRCILQIAREPSGYLTIPQIAKREALTSAYVAKLMRLLLRGGLLQSTRGKNGGYRLARPAEQISVLSVLDTLSTPIFSKEFCNRFTGTACACRHDSDCAIRALWMAIDSVVRDALSATMITTLFRKEREMQCWNKIHITHEESDTEGAPQGFAKQPVEY
jgi:Rrf2 family protein